MADWAKYSISPSKNCTKTKAEAETTEQAERFDSTTWMSRTERFDSWTIETINCWTSCELKNCENDFRPNAKDLSDLLFQVCNPPRMVLRSRSLGRYCRPVGPAADDGDNRRDEWVLPSFVFGLNVSLKGRSDLNGSGFRLSDKPGTSCSSFWTREDPAESQTCVIQREPRCHVWSGPCSDPKGLNFSCSGFRKWINPSEALSCVWRGSLLHLKVLCIMSAAQPPDGSEQWPELSFKSNCLFISPH